MSIVISASQRADIVNRLQGVGINARLVTGGIIANESRKRFVSLTEYGTLIDTSGDTAQTLLERPQREDSDTWCFWILHALIGMASRDEMRESIAAIGLRHDSGKTWISFNDSDGAEMVGLEMSPFHALLLYHSLMAICAELQSKNYVDSDDIVRAMQQCGLGNLSSAFETINALFGHDKGEPEIH